jgi:hypothetical protein
VHLADVVELGAEPGCEHRHRATPCQTDDTGLEDQRELVERLPESHDVEEHVRLEIRRVVEDLHDPHGVDTLASAQERERDEVVGEARIDAGGETRGAARFARGLEWLGVAPWRRRRVHERDDRCGDDVGARFEDAGHVAHSVVGTQIAGRGVRHAVRAEPDDLVGVGGGGHSDRPDPGELAGVAPGLVGTVHQDPGQL